MVIFEGKIWGSDCHFLGQYAEINSRAMGYRWLLPTALDTLWKKDKILKSPNSSLKTRIYMARSMLNESVVSFIYRVEEEEHQILTMTLAAANSQFLLNP